MEWRWWRCFQSRETHFVSRDKEKRNEYHKTTGDDIFENNADGSLSHLSLRHSLLFSPRLYTHMTFQLAFTCSRIGRKKEKEKSGGTKNRLPKAKDFHQCYKWEIGTNMVNKQKSEREDLSSWCLNNLPMGKFQPWPLRLTIPFSSFSDFIFAFSRSRSLLPQKKRRTNLKLDRNEGVLRHLFSENRRDERTIMVMATSI